MLIYLVMFVVSSWFNFSIHFSSIGLGSSWAMVWIGSVIVPFSTTWTFILEDFDASFWIFSDLVSKNLLSFLNFLIVSSGDFSSSVNFLICSFDSWLWLLRWQFSSCFSSNFPLISSLDCSVFWIFFNLLIFVTRILLWFLSRKISSVLLDNVLLIFVISNFCVFLMSSFFRSISFICCWCWQTPLTLGILIYYGFVQFHYPCN